MGHSRFRLLGALVNSQPLRAFPRNPLGKPAKPKAAFLDNFLERARKAKARGAVGGAEGVSLCGVAALAIDSCARRMAPATTTTAARVGCAVRARRSGAGTGCSGRQAGSPRHAAKPLAALPAENNISHMVLSLIIILINLYGIYNNIKKRNTVWEM